MQEKTNPSVGYKSTAKGKKMQKKEYCILAKRASHLLMNNAQFHSINNSTKKLNDEAFFSVFGKHSKNNFTIVRHFLIQIARNQNMKFDILGLELYNIVYFIEFFIYLLKNRKDNDFLTKIRANRESKLQRSIEYNEKYPF